MFDGEWKNVHNKESSVRLSVVADRPRAIIEGEKRFTIDKLHFHLLK